MKGFTFYIEYKNKSEKRKNINGINCIAAITENKPFKSSNDYCYDALGTFMEDTIPNDNRLCWGNYSLDYIQENCKRVSEKEAREIHPNLFNHL